MLRLQVYGVLSGSSGLARDQRLMVSAVSWLIVFMVLHLFFVRVLSNITDTMDIDRGVSSTPEVHDVLVLLAT